MASSLTWRLTIHKYWLGIGGPSWANTYEFATEVVEESDSINMKTFAEAVGQFEQALHVPQVYIDRAVISTSPSEGSIYDPTSFTIFPLGFQGDRVVDGLDQRQDLNYVFNVRLFTEQGRPGKKAYRGVLTESDTDSSLQGFGVLAASSSLRLAGATWQTAYAFIEPYVPSNGDMGFALIPQPTAANPNPNPTVRRVTGILPVGVGFSRFNHRYYDRGPQ